MARPLIVCDCDEVLLHMVVPFRAWLAEAHNIKFTLSDNFAQSMIYSGTGEKVSTADIWRLLGGFFDTEMPRQTPISGAIAALTALQGRADVAILTNLEDHRQAARAVQLAGHGLTVPVFTNQGPKGPALARIVAQYQPSHTLFIDDLPQHIASAAEHLPHISRLHLCGEPAVAPHIACAYAAGHAHARIDDWASATPWIISQLEERHDD